MPIWYPDNSKEMYDKKQELWDRFREETEYFNYDGRVEETYAEWLEEYIIKLEKNTKGE